MHADHFDGGAVHVELDPPREQAERFGIAHAVDPPGGLDRAFREDDDAEIADAVRIASIEPLMQRGEMLVGHFLQHDNVGIGLVEECVDLIDPLVFEPEIEGRDAQEPLGVGGSFGRCASQARDDESDIDRRQQAGQGDGAPVPRDDGKHAEGDRASRQHGQPVIDEIEPRPPLREPAETRQSEAEGDPHANQHPEPFDHAVPLAGACKSRGGRYTGIGAPI